MDESSLLTGPCQHLMVDGSCSCIPLMDEGLAHLQYLQHDGEAQLEGLELTQEIVQPLLLEAPADSLLDCDRL